MGKLSFFSHKIALVMQFCGKRKITLIYAMFININGSCQCLQIMTFMRDFSSVYFLILSKRVGTLWMAFYKNSIKILCQIIYVNNHCPESCSSPFNLCTKSIKQYKTRFTCFGGQHTSEFHYNPIHFTMICICGQNFGSFALLETENG